MDVADVEIAHASPSKVVSTIFPSSIFKEISKLSIQLSLLAFSTIYPSFFNPL